MAIFTIVSAIQKKLDKASKILYQKKLQKYCTYKKNILTLHA
jgi:hypothetical protein